MEPSIKVVKGTVVYESEKEIYDKAVGNLKGEPEQAALEKAMGSLEGSELELHELIEEGG